MKVILVPGHGGKAPKGEYQDFGAVSKDESVDEFHYYQDLIKNYKNTRTRKRKNGVCICRKKNQKNYAICRNKCSSRRRSFCN